MSKQHDTQEARMMMSESANEKRRRAELYADLARRLQIYRDKRRATLTQGEDNG